MDYSIRTFNGISPKLGQRVYVDPQSTVIGDVCLGDDVSVWPGAVIRGDMLSITVGARSNIQDNAILHTTHASDHNPEGYPLLIGKDVIIGHRAILHGCTLGSCILVGNGAIINDGALVKDQVVVGAGCIVPPRKILESGYIYVGNPCRKLRPLTEQEQAFFRYSAANYVKLKDQYLKEATQD